METASCDFYPKKSTYSRFISNYLLTNFFKINWIFNFYRIIAWDGDGICIFSGG